jgi:hypothetical protein
MSIERQDRHPRGQRATPMGNRHRHKKMRSEVRAIMAETGESYQTALSRLRMERRAASALARQVDLIPIDYFGTPLTLATFEILGDLSFVALSGRDLPRPFPHSPLSAMARRRILN